MHPRLLIVLLMCLGLAGCATPARQTDREARPRPAATSAATGRP
jgi:hypothetical protein